MSQTPWFFQPALRLNSIRRKEPINDKGIINAVNTISFDNPDPKLVLARLGVRMFLSQDLNRFDYLGRRPMENYADRKIH